MSNRSSTLSALVAVVAAGGLLTFILRSALGGPPTVPTKADIAGAAKEVPAKGKDERVPLPELRGVAGNGIIEPADRETKVAGFATPESVLWDPQADVYLVSNISGDPTGVDDDGFISRVAPDGTIESLRWIDGKRDDVELSAPKGSCLSGALLLVTDITHVRRFDRSSGALVRMLPGSLSSFSPEQVNRLCFSRDGQRLVVGHARTASMVFEVASGRVLAANLEPQRELLDAGALEEIEAQLQGLPSAERPRPPIKSADGLHDLLLRLGDLSEAELALRCEDGAPQAAALLQALLQARRIARVAIAGEPRYLALEDAARYRDALGTPLPRGLPESLLAPVTDPLTGLCRRYARTHGPFVAHELAARFALPPPLIEPILRRLVEEGRLLEGEFRPQGLHREFCDPEILQKIRRRSLAKLRREVEPAPARALGRLYTHWQGVLRPRRGLDALLDAIQSLQGAPLVASTLETEILPARISGYSAADLDTLLAAGEVAWVGLNPLGDSDGRLVLGLADQVASLLPPRDGEVATTPSINRWRTSGGFVPARTYSPELMRWSSPASTAR